MTQLSTYPLQNLGAGDKRALTEMTYTGKVFAAFQKHQKFIPHTHNVPIAVGDSVHGYAHGAMVGGIKEDDKEIGTHAVKFEKRPIKIDDHEAEAFARIPYTQQRMSPLNNEAIFADLAGKAIGEMLDSRGLRMGLIGARQPKSGNDEDRIYGGYCHNRTGATLAAAYPDSLEGSKRLQRDLSAVADVWRDRGIPGEDETWLAMMPAYLVTVLSRDTTLLSSDYTARDGNPNSRLKNRVTYYDGFMIEWTNAFPNKLFNANSKDWEAQYLGDFSRTAVYLQASPMVVGRAAYDEINAEAPDFDRKMRRTTVGATSFGGFGWQSKAEAAEIYFGDAYVANETTGVLAPAA